MAAQPPKMTPGNPEKIELQINNTVIDMYTDAYTNALRSIISNHNVPGFYGRTAARLLAQVKELTKTNRELSRLNNELNARIAELTIAREL